MDPSTHFLAAENSATLRRHRALHRSIVASPFVLMLAVGLVGHVHGKARVQPAGTRDYDRRVLAYRDRVIATEAALATSGASTGDQEREARQWVAGFAKGDLTGLTPACYEDHLRDGPRGEILRAGIELSTALAVNAEEAIRRGSIVQAARDGVLAAETSQGLRGFETTAFLQCLLTSRRGIGVVASAWPRLSVAERTALRPCLRTLIVTPREIDSLRALERDQLVDYQARQGSAAIQIEGDDPNFQKNIKSSEMSAMTRSVRVNNARLQKLIDDAPPRALRR